MPESALLPLRDLFDAPARASRLRLDHDAIERYAEVLREGGRLPEVSALRDHDGARIWVYDGAHRLEAHRRAFPTLLADLVIGVDLRYDPGDEAEARRLARRANRDRGVPLTRSDKRWQADQVLDEEVERRAQGLDPRTDAQLADDAGCSHTYIGNLWRERGARPDRKAPLRGLASRLQQAPEAPEAPEAPLPGQQLVFGGEVPPVEGPCPDSYVPAVSTPSPIEVRVQVVPRVIGGGSAVSTLDTDTRTSSVTVSPCAETTSTIGTATGSGPTRAQLADRVSDLLSTLIRLGHDSFLLREDWPTGGGEQDIISWLDGLDETPAEELAEVLPALLALVGEARRERQSQVLADEAARPGSSVCRLVELPTPEPETHPAELAATEDTARRWDISGYDEGDDVRIAQALAGDVGDDETTMLGEALDACRAERDEARADLAEAVARASARETELLDALNDARTQLTEAQAAIARANKTLKPLVDHYRTSSLGAIVGCVLVDLAQSQKAPEGWPPGWTIRTEREQPIADDPTASAQVMWFYPRAKAEVPSDDFDEETTAHAPSASKDLRQEHARLLAWAVSRLPTSLPLEAPTTPEEIPCPAATSPSPSTSIPMSVGGVTTPASSSVQPAPGETTTLDSASAPAIATSLPSPTILGTDSSASQATTDLAPPAIAYSWDTLLGTMPDHEVCARYPVLQLSLVGKRRRQLKIPSYSPPAEPVCNVSRAMAFLGKHTRLGPNPDAETRAMGATLLCYDIDTLREVYERLTGDKAADDVTHEALGLLVAQANMKPVAVPWSRFRGRKGDEALAGDVAALSDDDFSDLYRAITGVKPRARTPKTTEALVKSLAKGWTI